MSAILSDLAILAAMDKKEIVISPFNRADLGTNSYDVHLGANLLVYASTWLDAAKETPVVGHTLQEDGFELMPGVLFLGVTEEYTETWKHVPFLDGKSSVGRLGIFIHATAGRGDVGFCGHWTLEMTVVQPIRIYPGMPIGQLIFFEVSGEIGTRYDQKETAKYNLQGQQENPLPKPSLMWKNFPKK